MILEGKRTQFLYKNMQMPGSMMQMVGLVMLSTSYLCNMLWKANRSVTALVSLCVKEKLRDQLAKI